MKRYAVLFGLLCIATALQAEAVDPMTACDRKNDSCLQACNNQENADASCYEACDTQYMQCLDKASQVPEQMDAPEETPPVAAE